MNTELQCFSNSITRMLEEGKEENPPLDPQPLILPLKSIYIEETLFQPRQFLEDSGAASEDHTTKLTEALCNEASKTLDAITVWWSGRRWYVLDGAHRFKAYHRAKRLKGLTTASIPVEVFSGNLYQALAECARLNSKDKLPMTKSDKLNRAWKLTVLNQHSKREIHSICKVGTTTVSRMRNLLLKIKEQKPQIHADTILNMSWEDAQRSDRPEIAYNESWIERIAIEWAERLAKSFGTKAAKQPEIFAKAIELYSEKLPKSLVQNWWELTENTEEDF